MKYTVPYRFNFLEQAVQQMLPIYWETWWKNIRVFTEKWFFSPSWFDDKSNAGLNKTWITANGNRTGPLLLLPLIKKLGSLNGYCGFRLGNWFVCLFGDVSQNLNFKSEKDACRRGAWGKFEKQINKKDVDSTVSWLGEAMDFKPCPPRRKLNHRLLWTK